MKVKPLKKIRKRFEYSFIDPSRPDYKHTKVIFWDKKLKTGHTEKTIRDFVENASYRLGLFFYTSADTLTKSRLRRRKFLKALN